jgi:outer membrane immunogenic protein
VNCVLLGRLGISALLIAAPLSVASAENMATKAPPPTPAYNWNGFYFGGEIGGGWESNQATRTDNSGAPNFPFGFVGPTGHLSGLLGGGYVGFNYQIDKFVIGIEGDYSWANLKASVTDVGLTGGTANVTERVNWIATSAGRLGYVINNWMLFGKAGWAWDDFTGIASTNNNVSDTRNGWTIGTGVEWAFTRHWSAKLEYDYVKFNTINQISTNVAFHDSATSSLNMMKLGVAYLF